MLNKNKLILAVVLVVLALLAGFFWYGKNHQKPAVSGPVLADKDRSLTSQAEKIYFDRIKKAEDDLKSAKANDPAFHIRQVNDYTYLGQQYFGLGLLEKSKQQYLMVLKLDAKNEAALVGLAFVFSDAGNLGEAQKYLEIAKQNNPKNYNVWLQFIDVRKAQNTGNEEIGKLFEDALLATNKYPDIITRYAQFQESIGKIKEAIKLWEEAIKQNPDATKLYNQEISRLKLLNK